MRMAQFSAAAGANIRDVTALSANFFLLCLSEVSSSSRTNAASWKTGWKLLPRARYEAAKFDTPFMRRWFRLGLQENGWLQGNIDGDGIMINCVVCLTTDKFSEYGWDWRIRVSTHRVYAYVNLAGSKVIEIHSPVIFRSYDRSSGSINESSFGRVSNKWNFLLYQC